jgi:hypothetical protein
MNSIYRLYVGLSPGGTPETIDGDQVVAWVAQHVDAFTSLLSGFANVGEIRVHEDLMMNRQYLFSSDQPSHFSLAGGDTCL